MNTISTTTIPYENSLVTSDPVINYVYLAKYNETAPVSVSRLNGSTYERIGEEIELTDSQDGSIPRKIVIDPVSKMLYVAILDNNETTSGDGSSGFVYVLDASLESPKLVRKIRVSHPIDIAVDSEANRIYIADLLVGIHTVDGTTNKIVKTRFDPPHPGTLAFNPNTGALYAINSGTATVHVIYDDGVPFSMSSELDGETYTVSGRAENVTVHSLDIRPGFGIALDLNPQPNYGTVELLLPKDVIDGIIGVNVTASGTTINVEFEKSDNSTHTTITFDVPANTDLIEVKGTKVVPEFGQIAMILVVISAIAGTILFHRMLARRIIKP